ncbi:translation initiation factor eIF-2B alpha subunit [Pelomyxa schiedti]|nr:translation initiation factor eIF-2B alpha subunit [Pelomyxa schiedti]
MSLNTNSASQNNLLDVLRASSSSILSNLSLKRTTSPSALGSECTTATSVVSNASPNTSPGLPLSPVVPQSSSTSTTTVNCHSPTPPPTLSLSPPLANLSSGSQGVGDQKSPVLPQSPPSQRLRPLGSMSWPSTPKVVENYEEWLKNDPQLSATIHGLNALLTILKGSTATTIMGLRQELDEEAAKLFESNKATISVASGCALFLQFVTHIALDVEDIEQCKAKLVERAELLITRMSEARDRIATIAYPFITDGSVFLVHGSSKVVLKLLQRAAQEHISFRVICTESRPGSSGFNFARSLQALTIPVEIILDSAVAAVMDKVDAVICGSEAIVENGGIINKIGTFQISIVAKAFNKPFYVAAESFKFIRLYPLTQSEIPQRASPFTACAACSPALPSSIQVFNPHSDYTPPNYITLLFTELGVLTPSAVSDELIKLSSLSAPTNS